MRPSSNALNNPFTMMTNPDVILQAVAGSDRLKGLKRRVCRPLDRPLIPRVGSRELADYDREIDLAVEEEIAED